MWYHRMSSARVLGWCMAVLIGAALLGATRLGPLPGTRPMAAATATPSEAAALPDVEVGAAVMPGGAADTPVDDPLAAIGELVPMARRKAASANAIANVPALALDVRPRASGVITRVNTTQKVIAFTFDFDMTPSMLERLRTGRVKAWYDPAVLDVLEREQARATFFVAGLAAVAYPELIHSLAQNSRYEIGNHSNRHFAFAPRCYGLPVIPDGEDRAEVEAGQRNIHDAGGTTPAYFRFPGGCYEAKDVEIIGQLGLSVVGWDVVSGDAFNPNALTIVRRVVAGARSGSIVLFHVGGPNAPQTANALKVLLPLFKAQGYSFVTLSELLSAAE